MDEFWYTLFQGQSCESFRAKVPLYPFWRTLEKINASHQETQIGKNKGIRWYKGRSWNHRLLGLPSSYCLAPSAPGGPPFGPGFLLEDSKTAKEDPMAEHIFWCNVFRWQSIASRFAFFLTTALRNLENKFIMPWFMMLHVLHCTAHN